MIYIFKICPQNIPDYFRTRLLVPEYKIMYHENENVNRKKVGNTFHPDIKKTLLWGALHKLLGLSNIISEEETYFTVSEHP